MITGVHILLTYKCSFECDHCFVYSSPRAKGTMTLPQIRKVLAESRKIESVKTIFFEGGEPFLFYPTMLEGIRIAQEMEFDVGIVTNAYGAISPEDAEVWLRPLAELGIPVSTICIQPPFLEEWPGRGHEKGNPIIGGGAMFKGRAVEKLISGLPRRPWKELNGCPHEDLLSPGRVHVDTYGNVHLCQGLSMGNMWKRPLSELVLKYRAPHHPICGPLVEGGPARLAQEYDVEHEEEYVDECHFCYLVRRALINRFPEYLAPRQVYGLAD